MLLYWVVSETSGASRTNIEESHTVRNSRAHARNSRAAHFEEGSFTWDSVAMTSWCLTQRRLSGDGDEKKREGGCEAGGREAIKNKDLLDDSYFVGEGSLLDTSLS